MTMVQRSTTHVARSDSLMDLGSGALYSEAARSRRASPPTTADLIFASLPYRVAAALQVAGLRSRCASVTPDLTTTRLDAVGFQLDFGEDESGLFMKYLRRGSGYYIDVGACELVANGSIKLKNGRRSTI